MNINDFPNLTTKLGRCPCIYDPYELIESGKKLLEMEEDKMEEPDYYKHDGLSPIGAFKQGLMSEEEYIGFLKGNIIKYVVRAGKKEDAVKDLEKAKHYIDFYLEIFNEPTVMERILNEKEFKSSIDDDKNLCEDNYVKLGEILDKEDEEEKKYKVYKNYANTLFGEVNYDEELFVITKDNTKIKHTINGNDILCTNENRANALCDLLNKEDF